MGQYFYLINIDEALYAMKSFSGATEGGGKLGQWFFGNEGQSLVQCLTVPKLKLPEDPLDGQYFTSANRFGIHILPRELQEQIFEELDDFSDVFCFSLTSRYMWTIGIQMLRRLYVPWVLCRSGAWAGHRLIIARDSDYSHHPEDAFTDSELAILDNVDCNDEDNDDGDSDYSDGSPKDVSSDSDLAIIDNVDYNEDNDEGFLRPLLWLTYNITIDHNTESTLYLRLAGGWWYRGTPPWMKKFLTWTRTYHSSLEYPTEPVLHNLSKKEYICTDALTLPHGYHTTIRFDTNLLTLGHAVMSRIVWSNDRSVNLNLSEEFATKLVHGVWAGCRFDIVDFEEWKERDEDWKDVSAEVKEDLIYMALQDGALSYDLG